MQNNASGKNEGLSPREETAKAAILAESDKLAKADVIHRGSFRWIR